MRLFVAVDLDTPARAAIAAEQKRLAAAIDARSAPRWVRPDQMHLTLAFLGEVDDVKAGSVASAMAQAVGEQPFDLLFEGIGVFPPRGAPRALWVGASRGHVELVSLQDEIARRLTDRGCEIDRRPFSPHLTIGRWRDARPSDRARVLAAQSTGPIASVRIDHATLYRSHLSSAGSTYVELARANLSTRQGQA